MAFYGLSWLMTRNNWKKKGASMNAVQCVPSFSSWMFGNESIHEIDTVEGSQKLCSDKAPRPKRRRWMAVWMVMSKPRTHIVVCWDTVSMLHFLYISFTFPLHCSPEISREIQMQDLRRDWSAGFKGAEGRETWQGMETAMISTPHSPHLFILFMLFILFAGADLLIFWNRERKHIPDVHALPDWIAFTSKFQDHHWTMGLGAPHRAMTRLWLLDPLAGNCPSRSSSSSRPPPPPPHHHHHKMFHHAPSLVI